MSGFLPRHLRTDQVARDLAARRPRSESSARQALSDRTADLLFMLRAFQGLGHQLRTLDARIDWQAALEQTGEEHPLAKPTPSPVPGTLHIRVTEGGTTKLNLVFGAAAADNLVDLVPESLRPGLEARGICLRSIAEEAGRSADAPAKLFSAEDGARSIRAWLEA